MASKAKEPAVDVQALLAAKTRVDKGKPAEFVIVTTRTVKQGTRADPKTIPTGTEVGRIIAAYGYDANGIADLIKTGFAGSKAAK